MLPLQNRASVFLPPLLIHAAFVSRLVGLHRNFVWSRARFSLQIWNRGVASSSASAVEAALHANSWWQGCLHPRLRCVGNSSHFWDKQAPLHWEKESCPAGFCVWRSGCRGNPRNRVRAGIFPAQSWSLCPSNICSTKWLLRATPWRRSSIILHFPVYTEHNPLHAFNIPAWEGSQTTFCCCLFI